MRIAIFCDTFFPNFDGVIAVINKVTRSLADRGHEFVILVPVYGNREGSAASATKYEPHERIAVHRFSAISVPGNPDYKIPIPNYRRAKRILREFKPDVVHIHSPASMGIAGIVAAKSLGIRVIITYHTYYPDYLVCLSPMRIFGLSVMMEGLSITKAVRKVNAFLKAKTINRRNLYDIKEGIKNKRPRPLRRLIEWYLHNVYERCDIVTAPSEAMIQLLEEEGLQTRKLFISNGVDCNKFPPKSDYQVRGRLLHVGRISHEKRAEVVILAFKDVLLEFPKATLDIYGDGPARKYLEALVKKERIRNVRFNGFIRHDELPEVYRNCDVFLTASTIETQGLVILEAMSSGLPIVGVDKLAIPDHVRHGENGFLVKAGRPEEMAEAVTTLLREEALIPRMGRKAAQYARSHDFEKVLLEYERLYADDADGALTASS